MTQQVLDDRGWTTKVRRRLSPGIAKLFRSISLSAFALLPHVLKYRIAEIFQRRRYPYRLIEKGDRVVQVGAPRDILLGGRSRAIHFARAVGREGRVLVVEPDPRSAAALETVVAKHKLSSCVTVVPAGAWRERDKLTFQFDAGHPAANRVASLDGGQRATSSLDTDAAAEGVTIDVDSLSSILEKQSFGKPKLISITTNGAERAILEGIWSGGERFIPRYFSLAPPSEDNVAAMEEHGFRWVAWDDRGQLFERTTGLD